MSPTAIRKALDKLRLTEGDILIVKDISLLHAIIKLDMPPGTPSCPVIYAPDGIDKIRRESLQEILDKSAPSEPEPTRIISTEIQ